MTNIKEYVDSSQDLLIQQHDQGSSSSQPADVRILIIGDRKLNTILGGNKNSFLKFFFFFIKYVI